MTSYYFKNEGLAFDGGRLLKYNLLIVEDFFICSGRLCKWVDVWLEKTIQHAFSSLNSMSIDHKMIENYEGKKVSLQTFILLFY